YREIFVPVDNSSPSDWAVDRAIELCRKSDGRITGNHVYAARLHDVRFRQLETGLPARFQTPDEIKKQRKIHDKLIEKGLQLIAEDGDSAARLAGSSGRQYDLLAIGAHGLGRQPYSQLGGVVSRVLRGIEKDLLLVRDERPFAGGRFLVGVDGSSYGYRAMRLALELAQAFGGSLFVCSAFDVE